MAGAPTNVPWGDEGSRGVTKGRPPKWTMICTDNAMAQRPTHHRAGSPFLFFIGNTTRISRPLKPYGHRNCLDLPLL